MTSFRIGHGYDIHPLVEGRALVLGGVEIPHGKGLLGHSDADVLVHALMDACLGAAGLGDIGVHFPDTDPRYKGISSIALLAHVASLLRERGFRVVNADMTLLAERPKVAALYPEMRKRIAAALEVDDTLVNVKATTCERLGEIGGERAMAAYAVALLERQ